jgi:hypothetical protein
LFKDQEKRVAFAENVLAQAVGTALGGGLLFLVGSIAGVFEDISLEALVLAVAVLAAGLAALPYLILGAIAPVEAAFKRRIVKEAEEALRDKTDEERMRWFVPFPGGFAKAPWILEKMKEPFRAEVEDSLRRQSIKEGREGPREEEPSQST